MKCINCGTDNKLKDRTANYGKCSNCGHAFVFEPTSIGITKLTDPMFAIVINDISVNNTLFFTPKQMFYLLNSRFRKKTFISAGFGCTYIFLNVWVTGFFGGIGSIFVAAFGLNAIYAPIMANLIYQIATIRYLVKNTNSPKLTNASRQTSAKLLIFVGGFILVAGIFVSASVLNSFPLFVIVVLLGMFSIYKGFVLQNQTNIAQEFIVGESEYQDWLNRWQGVNGNIQKLLPAPQNLNNQTIPINSDVTAYSFDRLIVCESADIAQFLIANNFHFENNSAILSITGYPESIFQTTMDMLRRNPELKVYALHNCTPKGLGLINRLRTSSNWFQNSNITIIDIGITPRQVLANQNNLIIEKSSLTIDEVQLPNETRSTLTLQELQWLQAGNFVNLESFKPQQLIQIIQRRISNSQNLENNTSLLAESSSSDIYIYAPETFG